MTYKVQILNRNNSDLDDSVHQYHIDQMIVAWEQDAKIEVHQEFTFVKNGIDKLRRDYEAICYRNVKIVQQEDTVLVTSILVPIKM